MLKLKTNERADDAGKALAKAMIEMIHLMYQNNTALVFLRALNNELWKEETKRLAELDKKEKDVKSK